jgi:hypothetical protein
MMLIVLPLTLHQHDPLTIAGLVHGLLILFGVRWLMGSAILQKIKFAPALWTIATMNTGGWP